MKIPEKPPAWLKAFRNLPPKAMGFFATTTGRKLLAGIGNEYLHWEKVKYKKIPKYMEPSQVWAIVKATRLQGQRSFSLNSASGKEFWYSLPDSVHRELHLFDSFAAGHLGLDTSELSGDAKHRYLVSSLMEEAIASSQIEGAATTRPIAKEMLRTGRKPRDTAEQMILNNYRTIQRIKHLAKEPLTIELLNDLQESMTEGTLDDPSNAGRFRSPEENIHVVDMDDGKSLHVPPPAEKLESRVQQMCDFANKEDGSEFIHPIIKAVLLHFWLAYEHPYIDGNGRTARALFYWYAISRGYWVMEYLSISRIIMRSRRRYYRSFLYAEGDGLDATYFIVYHLRALNLAMKELRRYLERKQKEYRESLNLLRNWRGLNYRQQALLRHALKNPLSIYTIKSHMNSHNTAYATARNDLLILGKRGLLIEDKVGRQFQFLVPEDLNENIIKGQQ